MSYRTRNLLLLMTLVLLLRSMGAEETATNGTNPFRSAKVGDWVEWKTVTQTPSTAPEVPPISSQSHIKETVKSIGRELLSMQVEIMGQKDPVFMETQYPLHRPYQPEWLGQQGKEEQTKEPETDKLEIAGKKWDCVKREMKLTTTHGVYKLKLWTCPAIPFGGIARMELTAPDGTLTIREVCNFLTVP